MKIGIDCRMFSSNFTGIGRYSYELVKQLIKINDKEKRKHELVLFFNNPEYKKYNPPNPAVKKVLVKAKHYSFAEQTRFLHKLNKEKCDTVHFPHFNIPIFYRKPYVVTIHDLILTFFHGHKMTSWHHRLAYNLIIKNSIKKSKKIIAVSNSTKQDIIANFKVPEEKIEVVYNGISPSFTLIQNPSKYKKTLSRYNIDKQFLLYTGVWRSHKNLVNLIEAFNILKNKKSLDLKLVITGKPDPYYPEVKETIKRLNLKEDVILTGLVQEKELVHLYNAAHIYVFPSLYEGFGLPPLESMKCGTPVAASETSSIPEICGEKNAVFFDPKNPRDIAKKIYMIYKNTDLQA
ncbi:glycosyltransferase, partial [Candidatus Peregrinibacteria bacterium]|nr:glycosyltransferase [Candidatus Peregrinibacteria bacterium]